MKTREVARRAVQQQIALVAIERFKLHGFDRTTVEDIAGHIGMSTRNFFRYFPSKEDVLLGPDTAFGATYLAEFQKVLPTDDLWDALRLTMESAIGICSSQESRQVASDRQSLIQSTPALLARQLGMIERLQSGVTEAYLTQGSRKPDVTPQVISAIVRSAFACWSAVIHHEEAIADVAHTVAALKDVMMQLRPKALIIC